MKLMTMIMVMMMMMKTNSYLMRGKDMKIMSWMGLRPLLRRVAGHATQLHWLPTPFSGRPRTRAKASPEDKEKRFVCEITPILRAMQGKASGLASQIQMFVLRRDSFDPQG